MPLKEEKTVYIVGMAFSAIFGLSSFTSRFSNHLAELYWTEGSVRVLKDGAIMPDFVEILDRGLLGFQIVGAIMVAAAVMHYAYHFHESKSIYTMRRLPSRLELHRRCLTLPAAGIILAALAAFVILLICFASYMLATPDACLTPGQWQKIWSVKQ